MGGGLYNVTKEWEMNFTYTPNQFSASDIKIASSDMHRIHGLELT
jgi:hypothetical protein